MPKFREITGQFVGYIPDSIDADIVPDRAPMNGRVTFTPVFTGGVIAFPELSPPEFAHPRTIHAKIVDGFVQVEVNEGEGDDEHIVLQPLSLMVTVDDEASQVWSWRAEFSEILIGASDEYVQIPSWSFRVPDGTGPVDLTELVPLKSTGTVDVTKGPRGAGLENITAVDGQLVFAYSDGQESTIPVPEAVQGPQGEPGPAGADGEQGPEGPQGPAGEIPDLLVGNITDATPTGKNLMLAATEGAARDALGLAAGATAINGSLSELNNGTSNSPRVWTPANLANYVLGQVGRSRESYMATEYGADPTGSVSSTDELAATIAAANANGKSAVVPRGTYLLGTALSIPAGSALHFDDATLIGGSNYEVLKFDEDNVTVTGSLTVTRDNSVANVRAVKFSGDNISVESLSVVGSEPALGSASGNELAVGVLNADRISIGELHVENFDFPVRFQTSSNITIRSGSIRTYRRGIYINSSTSVNISNFDFSGRSPSAAVAAGHNAILIEATIGHGTAANIRLNNLHVSDSGEHGIRLGGQQKIRNVWMTNVHVENAGSCGVKILGGTQASANYHENIFMRGILVSDCGADDTSMAGVMIQFAKNVTLSDYQAVPVANTYSCGAGIEMQAVDGVQVVNPIIRGTSICGIFVGFILGNVSNVSVAGGVVSVAAGVGLSVDYTNRVFSNVVFSGTQVEATTSSAKCAKIRMGSGTPTVASCIIGFRSASPSSRIFDTGTETLYTDWKCEIEAPYMSVPFRDGSTWAEWSSGVLRVRKSGAWEVA